MKKESLGMISTHCICSLQTHPCFHYRDTCNENRVPCNENRFFPVRKTSQRKPCFHYMYGFAVLPGGLKGTITLLMLWTTRGHYNSSPLASLTAAADTCLPGRHGLASMSSRQTGKPRYFIQGYCQLVKCGLICSTRSKKG